MSRAESVQGDDYYSVVYFVQPVGGGLIKIGITTRPVNERLKMLQTGSPVALQVIATCPGHSRREQELHRQFAKSRRHGEWFEPSADLVGFIAELAKSADPFGSGTPKWPSPRSTRTDAEFAAVIGKAYPDVGTYYPQPDSAL
jgi:hypothetical protein